MGESNKSIEIQDIDINKGSEKEKMPSVVTSIHCPNPSETFQTNYIQSHLRSQTSNARNLKIDVSFNSSLF